MRGGMAANGKKPEKKHEWGMLLSASGLGFTLVASTAIGLAIGIGLDRWWHSAPWATMVFLLIGIIAGFWQIIKEMKRINGNM
jgi:ATP synthase protein I